MKNKIYVILIFCIILITGCFNSSYNYNSNNSELDSGNDQSYTNGSDVKMSNIKVIIEDKDYTLKLENNKTAEEFVSLLPKEFNMSELNGNEKYVYMRNSLTTNSFYPKHIEIGDVMLFGDNCLVIFYKSFDTSYSYTKIGHIENLDNLGNDDIIVKFEK